MKIYANNLAFYRLCLWIVSLVCVRLVDAAPSFRLIAYCTERSTENTYLRVIASAYPDMSSAISVNLNFEVNKNGPFPWDSGYQTGNAGVDQGQLYYQWQVQDPDDLSWLAYSEIMGPHTHTSGFQDSHEFFGAQCYTLTDDWTIAFKNPNPFGGTFTPRGPGGTPLPKPPEWPANLPWPPYLGPGGSYPITFSPTNWLPYGVSNFSQINITFAPGAPPMTTNITYTTNITAGVTNISGGVTNITPAVTNITQTTTTTGGLPSGGTGTGSAADGSELLGLAISEGIMAGNVNTATATNLLNTLIRGQTNGPYNPSTSDSTISAQEAQASSQGLAFKGLFDSVTAPSAPSFSPSASAPSITFPDGAGGLMAFSLNTDILVSTLSPVRTLLVWGVVFFVTWSNWRVLETNVRMLFPIIPAQSAGQSVAGCNANLAGALIAAALIVGVWSVATASMLGAFDFSSLATGPASLVAVLPYAGWIDTYVPITEMLGGLASMLAFRLIAFKAAVLAAASTKFFVGL